MNDMSLDLFSCNKTRWVVGAENSWGAAVAVTVPGVVMYGEVSQTGMMNPIWATCLCWAHSTRRIQSRESRAVPAPGAIHVHEPLV